MALGDVGRPLVGRSRILVQPGSRPLSCGNLYCMSTEDLARVNLVISGRVQGVFFRASTLEQAQSLHVAGWVKNLPDGMVEVLAEGSRQALEDLVNWCHHGPSAANVEEVQAKWSAFRGEFKTFTVTR